MAVGAERCLCCSCTLSGSCWLAGKLSIRDCYDVVMVEGRGTAAVNKLGLC